MGDYQVIHKHGSNTYDLTTLVDSFEVTKQKGKSQTATVSVLLEELAQPITEGDTLEIYGSSLKIFSGSVKSYKRKSSEGQPVLEATAEDISSTLELRTVTKRYTETPASTILVDLLQPLSGQITTNHVQSNTVPLTLTLVNKTILEGVEEICARTGWMWYIDANKDFHFFESGTDRGTLTEEDLDSHSYKKDTSNIINRVAVLGKQYLFPTSGDLCEELSGTNGTWTASGTLSLADKDAVLPPRAGSYSIRSSAAGINSQYLQFTFATPLDFSQKWSPKKINVSIGNAMSSGYLTDVSIYLYKDTSNYFSSGNLVNNFDKYATSWKEISLEVGPDTSWSSTGSPTWDSISKVRIQVQYSTYISASLFVDKLFFSEGRIYATAEDTNSQNTYGLHECPAIIKDSLRTTEECQEIANSIIQENKDPKDILENIVTIDLKEAYELGDLITISVSEGTISNVKIVGLTHHLDEGDLYTELEISSLTKTAAEIVQEHEQRLGEDESENLEPSVTVSGPSATPQEPTVVLDYPPGPPVTPVNLQLTPKPLSILLTWDANTEADLDRYIILRGTISGGEGTFAAVDTNMFTDTSTTLGVTYYYKVKAVDRVGNESGPSTEVYGSPLKVDAQDQVFQNTLSVSSFTVSAYNQVIDTVSDFKVWLNVTITRVEGAGGYFVSYRKYGTSDWHPIFVQQPSSGNPSVNTTFLEGNTTYEVEVCAVTKLGEAGPWNNTFTFIDKNNTPHYNVTTATTAPNQVAPSAPASASATPAIDGLIIECGAVFATDFSHYVFYVGTTYPPSTPVGTSTRPIFFWKASDYSAYYVGAAAVDTALNASSVTSSSSTYTPLKVTPLDLSIESRPWTSNLKIFENCVSRGTFYYGSSGAVESWKRYVRTDTVTVGSNTYYNFGLVNSDTSTYVEDITGDTETYYPVYCGIRIFKVASDGTETELTAGTPVAIVYRSSNGSGIQTADYSFGGATFATTDRLCIKFYIDSGSGYQEKIKAVTEQLNVTSLPAGTWRVSYYSYRSTSYFGGIYTTRGRIYFGAGYDTSIVTTKDATIKFADGTTKTIAGDLSGTKLSSSVVGNHFVYWQDTDSNLHITTDYSSAVGTGKGLVTVIDRKTDAPSTILMFDSYTPTIGAGCIAAKSILADHIKAGQINTTHITSDSSLAIKASQILLDGTTYFVNSWQKAGDVTKIDGGQISAQTVTATQIAANAITTDQLQLSRLDTNEPTKEGALYYWTPDDTLRFIGQTGEKGYIPRYPLTKYNAPPETILPNPCFEEDVDGDDIPDYWTPPSGTKGTDYGSSSSAYKGKRCIWSKISTSGTYKEWQSVSIPVRPGQKLYARCYAKADNSYTPAGGIIHIAWYAPDGSSYLNEVQSSVKTLGTSWDYHEVTATVPTDGTYQANVRYARIHLYAGTSATYTTYYDDVVFSEIRAAVPTTGIVNARAKTTGTAEAIRAGTWNKMYCAITVPNEDFEVLICHIHLTTGLWIGSDGYANEFAVAVKNESTGEFYPSSDPEQCPPGWINAWNEVKSTALYNYWTFVITIPKNIKGNTIDVYVYNFGIYDPMNGMVNWVIWGHSPHTHR